MTEKTCEEMFEDGPCGEAATHVVTLPKEKAGVLHHVCKDCADYHIEVNGGSLEEQPKEPVTEDNSPANHTPDEHSDLVGGSTAARRINCPRSYALEKIAPADKGSAYAREGTALHEMIAIVVGEGKKPDALLPFTFSRETKGAEEAWTFTVDDDLWFDIGQPALDAFDDFCDMIEAQEGEEMVIEVEKRCAMPGIPGAFGTTDIVWKCGSVSGVWDWKFGRTPVSADSDQLRFYGRAAAADNPHLFGAKSWGEIDQDRVVILAIMQPQSSHEPSLHETTVADLEAFRLELMAAVDEAQTKMDKAPIAKGKWCTFATCKSVCPLHIGQSLEFGEKMAKLKEVQSAQELTHLRDVEVVDNEDENDVETFGDMLPHLLSLAEIAKDFADEVMKQAHAYLEDGGEVEGWGLKHKRSSGRVWTVDDEEVKKFMKNRKYAMDDYMPRKLMTMPQIEKLLKRDGRTIPEEMFEAKASSGTTLTRAYEGVELVGATSERVKTLGNKLAALRDETTEA